jgi:hypothetical protein
MIIIPRRILLKELLVLNPMYERGFGLNLHTVTKAGMKNMHNAEIV